ncbi:hypothetical protein ACP4OV_008087 [Aristida adscensionis]
MLRQSSGRNYRSRRLRPRHSFQLFLLVAVGVWLVYQLAHYYGRRGAVVEEADDGSGIDDGEPARRRLGRKGFVDIAGVESDDDAAGSDAVERGGGSSDDALTKAAVLEDGDGDGDEDDQLADEDVGGDGDGDDAADDGLAADGEELAKDFQAGEKGGGADELTSVGGETPSGLSGGAVPLANTTFRVQDGVAMQLVNATDGASNAAHGGGIASTDVKRAISQNGTTGSAATKANKVIAK